MEVSQNTENRATLWTSYFTLSHVSEGSEIIVLRRYLHSHILCCIIYNRQDMEKTQVSTHGWLEKESVGGVCVFVCVCVYKGRLFNHKKEGNLAICNTIDGLQGFPGSSVVKNTTSNAEAAGDMGSIPRTGRSPGGENAIWLQYSCLENPMAGRVWDLAPMGSQRIGHDLATEHRWTSRALSYVK